MFRRMGRQSRRRLVGFQPPDLPGCAMWLRADVGLVPNSSWTDVVSAIRFTYTAGAGTMVQGASINGRPTADFTAGGILTSTTTLAAIVSAGSNAGTYLTIFQYTGAVADQANAYQNPGIISDTGGYFWQSVSTTLFHNGIFDSATKDDAKSITTSTNYYALSIYDAQTSGTIKTSLNGAALDAGVACGSEGASTGTLNVAVRYDRSTSFTFAGSIAHIVAWNRVLTAAEQTTAMTWAHQVSGI